MKSVSLAWWYFGLFSVASTACALLANLQFEYFASCLGNTVLHHDVGLAFLGVELIVIMLQLSPTSTSANSGRRRSSTGATGESALAARAERVTLTDFDNWDDATPTLTSRRSASLTTRIPRAKGIDWNSVWMTLYFAIYFLGFHASLYGWRVYGNGDSLVPTFETCQHLPAYIRRSRISEFSYVLSFWSCAGAFLAIRKYRPPYWLSSYFDFRTCKRFFRCRLSFSSYALIVCQLGLFGAAVGKITEAWMRGYGTPMAITFGVLMGLGNMLVLVTMTHVLQIDYDGPTLEPPLEYHWLWATLALSICHACGFLFYLSVYGFPLPDLYFLWHIAAWAAYLVVLGGRFRQVFPDGNIRVAVST